MAEAGPVRACCGLASPLVRPMSQVHFPPLWVRAPELHLPGTSGKATRMACGRPVLLCGAPHGLQQEPVPSSAGVLLATGCCHGRTFPGRGNWEMWKSQRSPRPRQLSRPTLCPASCTHPHSACQAWEVQNATIQNGWALGLCTAGGWLSIIKVVQGFCLFFKSWPCDRGA